MKIGEKFRPHPNLKTLYYSYLLIPSVIIVVGAILPAIAITFFYLSFTNALIISALLLFSFLLVVGLIAFWIPKYHSSISYLFADSEIVVEKGVWWKHKNTIPYNRITNIDVVQGPISRRFGLGNVRVQTAGYSGTGGYGRVAEASIFGVENFEEIRDFVMGLVRGFKPVAVEAGVEVVAPEETSREILAELRKIREILERQTP
jgi:hypothetical protein